MTVNGLKLPDAFVALINGPKPLLERDPKGGEEAWVYKGGVGGIYWEPISEEEFDEAAPDIGMPSVQFCQSLEEVEWETNHLPISFHVGELTAEQIAEANAWNARFLGFLPFSTDFSQLVCFGTTGAAEPYCFDYRENPDDPSIIQWYCARWRRFSPNFDAFISMYEELDQKRIELDDPDW